MIFSGLLRRIFIKIEEDEGGGPEYIN